MRLHTRIWVIEAIQDADSYHMGYFTDEKCILPSYNPCCTNLLALNNITYLLRPSSALVKNYARSDAYKTRTKTEISQAQRTGWYLLHVLALHSAGTGYI